MLEIAESCSAPHVIFVFFSLIVFFFSGKLTKTSVGVYLIVIIYFKKVGEREFHRCKVSYELDSPSVHVPHVEARV